MSNVFREGFSGNVPENYDRFLGPAVFEPYAVDLAARLKPSAGMNVLEVAAGSGRVTRHLLSRLPKDGALVATDLSPFMLQTARSRIQDARVKWQEADAQTLPFPSESFDAVVCQFGVMFFPDRIEAYREALRVLRPGGVYLFNSWGRLDDNPWAAMAQEVMNEQFPPDPPRFMHKPYSYSDEGLARQELTAAGFGDIQTEWVDFIGESSDSESFAQGVVEGTPLGADIERHGGDLKRCLNLLSEVYASKLGSAPMRSAMRALVAMATKS